MSLTLQESRQIYEAATSPSNTLTNEQIGKEYGVTESTVRHHIKKWKTTVASSYKYNEHIQEALASHIINVNQEASDILDHIKVSIKLAKDKGTPPEKLGSLYNNWIRSLELVSELSGDLDRSNNINIDTSNQFTTFMQIILEECDDPTRTRIISRLNKTTIPALNPESTLFS